MQYNLKSEVLTKIMNTIRSCKTLIQLQNCATWIDNINFNQYLVEPKNWLLRSYSYRMASNYWWKQDFQELILIEMAKYER